MILCLLLIAMKFDIITILLFWTYHLHSALCQNEVCGDDGNVRLLGGETNMEGSVQVCREGVWGGVRYCGQSSSDANVICKQLGYSQTGGVILDGVFMASNVDNQHYISCLGNEDTVTECESTCDTSKFNCCKRNLTLEVRCNKKGNECSDECSIVVEVVLGAVSSLLLVLLLASTISIMILGTKLRISKQKPRQYDSEPHQYVEHEMGQARATVVDPIGHTYADPVTFHKNVSSDKEEADYINTSKCIAYKQNTATPNPPSSTSALPTFQPSSSPNDEYEVMQQLTYNMN